LLKIRFERPPHPSFSKFYSLSFIVTHIYEKLGNFMSVPVAQLIKAQINGMKVVGSNPDAGNFFQSFFF
jgi:hypothetical protein